MTKYQLQLAIEALFVKMNDAMDHGIKGASSAFEDAVLGLAEIGIKYSKKNDVEFREDPNLDDNTYFNLKYVKPFQKVRDQFMDFYDAALVDRGRKPSRRAA
jgi:hypothetical protein